MNRQATAGERIPYRPYLDGLRAVAVLGVLVYHLDRDWLPGGFLGVDVFFVLSGFLITTLLLTEHGQTGRIDLPAFWARRIRRLLPALLVLLVVVAILVNLSGDLLAEGQARGDLLSTLLYVANWHFILTGQSYFTQYVAVSPDRHTWSLAIEEQFYLVWPVIVAVVLARAPRRALPAVAAGVAIASAVAMVVLYSGQDPSRAYYGTDSRAFELLIGALLAMALAGPYRERVRAAGRATAPLGLAILLGAYLALPDDSALYYYGGAVLISLAVAGLIAGLEGGSRVGRALSVRPLVLVGLVSYGLYLWHFPVITFIQDSIGPTSLPGLAALAVALTFAATVASYLVVERPIRRRGQLIRYRLSPARLARLVPVASGAVAAVIVFSTAAGITSPAWDSQQAAVAGALTPGRHAAGSGATPSTSPGGSGTGPLAPSVSPIATSSSSVTEGARVVPGAAGWRIGLVGDSVMVSAIPGFQAQASAHGWVLLDGAEAACPVGYQPLYDESGTISPYAQKCQTAVLGLHEQLAAELPDVVIWHDLQSSLARRSPSGQLLLPGTPAWTDALIAEWNVALDRFLAAGAQVVVILPPLRSQAIPGCAGAPLLDRCRSIQHQDTVIRAATEAWFQRLDGRTGVHLVDVDPLLCPAGNPCPSRIDGLTVRLSGYDQTHFTDAGATWFAPRLMDAVIAALKG